MNTLSRSSMRNSLAFFLSPFEVKRMWLDMWALFTSSIKKKNERMFIIRVLVQTKFKKEQEFQHKNQVLPECSWVVVDDYLGFISRAIREHAVIYSLKSNEPVWLISNVRKARSASRSTVSQVVFRRAAMYNLRNASRSSTPKWLA